MIESLSDQKSIDEVNEPYPWEATVAVLSMLKNMPPVANVHEIAVRTADGAMDTINDITPERHTCVSQPHELTNEQQQQLADVLAEFPYTPINGPLNKTNVYVQKINTGDAQPQIKKQFPLSPYMLAEIEQEIKVLIERDIIQPINFSRGGGPYSGFERNRVEEEYVSTHVG